MDEDVPWLYGIALLLVIFMWLAGAVAFGLADLNAQVAAHRSNLVRARGGTPSGDFGAAYYGVYGAPSWSSDEASRWGRSAMRIDVPYASLVFGQPMAAQGGATGGIERFYPGPAQVYE